MPYDELLHYDHTQAGSQPFSVADATKVQIHPASAPVGGGSGSGVYTSGIDPNAFAEIKGTQTPAHKDSVVAASKDPFGSLHYPSVEDAEIHSYQQDQITSGKQKLAPTHSADYKGHFDSVVAASKSPFGNLHYPTVSENEITENNQRQDLIKRALNTAQQGKAPDAKGN